MNRSIKISDENYAALGKLIRVHETYNDVLTRLIMVHAAIFSLRNVVGGVREYGEWAEKQSTSTP